MSEWKDIGGGKCWLVVGELRAVVRPVDALSMSGVVRAYEWLIDGVAYERWIISPSASMTLDEAKAAAEQALREMHDALVAHFAPVLRWTFDERGTAFAELGQWRLEAGRGGWFVSVETPRNGRQFVATVRGVMDRSEARRSAEAALRALGVPFRVEGKS